MALKSGANINSESGSGRTPLHYAAANGMIFHQSFIFISNCSQQPQKKTFWFSIGNTKCVEILLKHDAHIDLKDQDDETPLELAVSNGIDQNNRQTVP